MGFGIAVQSIQASVSNLNHTAASMAIAPARSDLPSFQMPDFHWWLDI
jgi:hypothetical protein